MTTEQLDGDAVEHLKEYLRIPSVHPQVDYSGCVSWLQQRAAALRLPLTVVDVAPGKPVVLLTWEGGRPELPSLLLSSHMDVVPVYEESWTYPPFSAHEDAFGNIYARGAQDMKSVGVQYLEAVHRLVLQGYRPDRSVHICFTPDEEIGSHGMRMFVETDVFKKLNVGCELDEGVASPDEGFNLYYGERTSVKQTIVCTGSPGHGSLLHDNTAGEKLSFVLNKFMERRAAEKKKLQEDPSLNLGDVTTINLTMVQGGVQSNVVPPELRVVFDCRVSLSTDLDGFVQWARDVCAGAGEGVRLEQADKRKMIKPTKLDEQNTWWMKLKEQFVRMNLDVRTLIFPAATDARYLRSLGIPAFGFSPMNKTPVLLHDHDEFINKDIYLKGINIYMNIISSLASV